MGCKGLNAEVYNRHAPYHGSTAHEVEHLRRVEELLEPPEEAHPLVVTALAVDEDKQGGAGLGAAGLPGLVRAWGMVEEGGCRRGEGEGGGKHSYCIIIK